MVPRMPNNKRKLLPLPYPQNLILTLIDGLIESIEVTPDMEAGLEYALSTLTDMEREILKLRFEGRLTYEQIGELADDSSADADNSSDESYSEKYGKQMSFSETDHSYSE